MTRCCNAEGRPIAREDFAVIIPARHASVRLPGKPLADIHGRPMIQWVWERACASGASSVIIATDDARVRDACAAFGAQVEMTGAHHPSGTDRLAEVAHRRGFAADAILVNVQGDEPLVPPEAIRSLAAALRQHPGCAIATPVTRIESVGQWLDPNCVKAVRALDGRALYFSRAPIPWPRDTPPPDEASIAGALRHVGMYAYRADSLARFASLAPTALEQRERLEQLRALEHGMAIHLMMLERAPAAGVDTPEDLQAVRALLAEGARPAKG